MLAAENIELYYGASHILRRVSLVAERGQVTCVLGRNGVGKTSLMRAILGLQPIRAGRILWDGEDITKLKPHERARRGLALVPQGREIFPRLTVAENLATGLAPLPRHQRRLPEEIFAHPHGGHLDLRAGPVVWGCQSRRGPCAALQRLCGLDAARISGPVWHVCEPAFARYRRKPERDRLCIGHAPCRRVRSPDQLRRALSGRSGLRPDLR